MSNLDTQITAILNRSKTIAIVGFSANPDRASHGVAKFWADRGARVIGINPGLAGQDFFDETVGIYLAFCVLPPKGQAPTPCGGGINKAGLGEASFWISSNPPPYAAGLTEEFLPGGRFTQKVKISKKIGKFDCTKVKCAITVRADHLRGNDRSSDLFIPITVK